MSGRARLSARMPGVCCKNSMILRGQSDDGVTPDDPRNKEGDPILDHKAAESAALLMSVEEETRWRQGGGRPADRGMLHSLHSHV
jgi:hypothetical protein